ncbi:hypothetical protein I4U23_008580 [Adineta vaga]|nr:hypothetical protein I4U23_008580 [Adineta vaga]
MSVLVPSLINNHHHPHTSYYSNNSTRRIHGNISQTKQNRLSINIINESEPTNDHVPHGVVNSMKQRFLEKVNESFLLNNNSTITRHGLSKPSSNENLLQTKPTFSSLKHTTRLSRSQDNLTNNHTINSIPVQLINHEQFTSYLQPKQDVIIIETTTNEKSHDDHHVDDDDDDDDDDDGDANVNDNDDVHIEKLHTGQKLSTHKQSYKEIHEDETPKPGTVTTVKNMFERQIRLSRYDADKIFNSSTPGSSRMSSQHREFSSPTRSRSASPNDMALRQRRTITSVPIVQSTSTTLSLPVPASYPDLVISHTPPTDTTKNTNEQIYHETVHQGSMKERKVLIPIRNAIPHEQIPLRVVIADESLTTLTEQHRPNLLLTSTTSSSSSSSSSSLSTEIVDCQPLDFKSRLALFNRTNTQKSNENSVPIKKSSNHSNSLSSTTTITTNTLTKPVVHQPIRIVHEEKRDVQPETISNPLLISISKSVINIAKVVTFFGGNRVNGNTQSSLPSCIPPPPPPSSFISQKNIKNDQLSMSTSTDVLRAPDIIGGNIKLNKSSIYSGTKKDSRVQFLDNIETFEYPSFEIAMAELGSTGSDNENGVDDDDDDDNDNNGTIGNSNTVNNYISGKMNDKQEQLYKKPDSYTNDDELERLARINSKFNTNNPEEKSLKPKGTLHTFRPTHLDQYELGTQHSSFSTSKSSDISSSTHSYSILARQKLHSSSDIISTKTLSNHPIIKYPQKPMFDMANNIQWSSMSTTTDLLF